VSDLYDQLRALEAVADTPEQRERARRARQSAADLQPQPFGNVVAGFDRADLAEASLGALVFGVPLFMDDTTVALGTYLARHPFSLAVTLLGTVALVAGILYVADIQDVRIENPLFGVVPLRMAAVLAVSWAMAAALLALWGNLLTGDPTVALGQVAAAGLPTAIGAALGDILPGS